MSKEKLRAKTIGARKEFRRVYVNVDTLEKSDARDGAGDFIEVRAPTMKGQTKITGLFRAKQMKNGEIEVIGDQARQMTAAIVECCFVPDSDERVFDETDVPAMLESPLDGYLLALGQAALELVNGSGAVAKKSEAIQSDS